MVKKQLFFMFLLALACISNETKAQCPVTIAPTPTNASVCAGQTATLTASGATTYTWSSNAGGVTTASVAVTPLQNTIYTVTATAGGGCTATQTVAIMVFSAPSVTATANPASVCPGGTSTLTASGATSYTWMAPATGNAATTTVTPAGYTTYSVLASNGICTDTQVVAVSISPLPTVTINAAPLAVCAGGTSTLTAGGANSYTWSPNAGGGNNPTAVVTTAATSTYVVTGANTAGCTINDTVIISVIPFLSLSINASPTGVCAGGTTTLTASGASSYSWSANAGGGTAATAAVTQTTATTYTVWGFSGGCSATQTVSVPIVNSITVSVVPNTPTVCLGSPVTFTASGAGSYTWSANAGGATTSTVTVTPFASTVYTVTGSSGACTATQTVGVIVNAIPTITVTASPSNICTGGATSTLTAGGAATTSSYTWSANAGGVNTNTTVVNPASTTIYTVTGANAIGCTVTQTVAVNVIPSLTITATANPTGICAGGTATLTASGAASYTWSANAGNATTPTTTVNPTVNTTYTVVGSSGQCVSSQVVNVSIVPSISVTISANPASVCAGRSATLTANGASTYTWSANAGTAQTQTVSVTPLVNTIYTVSASSGACNASQTVAVTVNPLPTVSITPPVGTTTLFCTGTPYQFIGNANPGPIMWYSWHSSTVVPGILNINIANGNCTNCNGPTITFGTVGPDTLTLLATTSLGCVDSVKLPVSISITPTVTTSSITPSPVICQGGTGAVIHVVGATTYTWTPLTNLIPYGNGDSASVNPPNAGVYTYSVTGTTGGCTSAPVAVTVTVTPPPIPVLVVTPSNDSICSGGYGHFYVNNLPPNTTYTWTQASTNVGLGTFSGSNTSISPYYTGVVDTTFSGQVSFTVPGCPPYSTYTMSIVVVPTPTIHVVSDTVENCNHTGDSLKVTCVPTSGVMFHWMPTANMTPMSGLGNPVFVNPTTTLTTLYYCTPQTISLGCTGKMDSVWVLEGDTTNAQIVDQYDIICSGQSDTLTALPQRNALNNTYQYYWSGGAGTLANGGDVFVVSPGGITTYTLTVKGTCVKKKTATFTVAVHNCTTPIPAYTVTKDTICVNHCVWYTDLTQNYTVRPLFYMWVFPGGTAYPCTGCAVSATHDTVWYVAADSNTIPKVKVCYTVNSSIHQGGVYPVEDNVSHSAGGPFATATGTIKVDQGPLANAGTNPTIELGDYVQLSGAGSTGNSTIVHYSWSPSDSLNCDTCKQPIAHPSQTTQYFLTVTDANGCISTDSMTVFVENKCYDPFIPTAFSPNGDNFNDILYVRSNCLQNFTFRVYDRWGEKVFETSDLKEGWDGRYRGQPLNAGVFVFTLDGFQIQSGGGNGKEIKQKGNVTLVR